MKIICNTWHEKANLENLLGMINSNIDLEYINDLEPNLIPVFDKLMSLEIEILENKGGGE